MHKPTIIYGREIKQSINKHGQYLLMRAGITNGRYPTQDFLDKINEVFLDGITPELRIDVNEERISIQSFAGGGGDTVTITDFYPNIKELEEFVNTSSRKEHTQLQGRR